LSKFVVFEGNSMAIASSTIHKFMAYYQNIKEEELKNRVGADWFVGFDDCSAPANVARAQVVQPAVIGWQIQPVVL
jgi:hypothetical protein